MTVHGRVSDIWRSYFTQRLLWERTSHIAFCPSLVNHIRNQHRLIKDFDAELPYGTKWLVVQRIRPPRADKIPSFFGYSVCLSLLKTITST